MATALEEFVQRQDWLGSVDTGMQRVADVTLGWKGKVAQKIRNFLHGSWLGHPLHPVLTNLPVRAWSTTAVFDVSEMLTGDRRSVKGPMRRSGSA
jgi:hypothetical protein